jgi:choline dehydrogenase-like flavoprotein
LYSAGILTSSAYDASLFYDSKGDSNSKNNNSRPDSQISIVSSAGTDKNHERNNMGIDLEDMELSDTDYAPTAEGIILFCTWLRPKSEGHVELDTSGKNNGIKIQPNYLSDPKDVQGLKQVIQTACQVVRNSSAPLSQLVLPTPTLPRDLCKKYNLENKETADTGEIPDDFWEEYVRRYAATLYHPTGTSRMSQSKQGGVVNHKLSVFGINNLRVADASIQPEIISGDTNASCVVIGERAAEWLRDEYCLQSDSGALRLAVNRYENRIWRNRVLLVLAAVVLISLLMASAITVGVWKYYGLDLWESDDPNGMCIEPNSIIFPI